jgi:hypothetical protein
MTKKLYKIKFLTCTDGESLADLGLTEGTLVRTEMMQAEVEIMNRSCWLGRGKAI